MTLKRQNTQGMPSSGGRYSNDQLRALWISNGGDNTAAPMAAAIALAESGGDPNATDYDNNGSVDRGLWQINSIHGSLSTFNPNGNAKAAISISGNGHDWSPWVTYQTGAYKQYLTGSSAQGTGTTGGGSSASQSDGTGSSTGGVANLSLSDLLSSPATVIGDFVALVSLGILKSFADGVGDYIIRPAWNFNLRTVNYYTYEIVFAQENQPWPTLTVAVFWGFGYVLLFTDPDSGNLKPAPVRKSRIARHARRLQQLPARQALIKPRHVEEKTPVKPKPVTSSTRVTQTGTMQTSRKIAVKVSGTHARADGTVETRSETVEPQGTVSSEKIKRASEPTPEPKPTGGTGDGSQKDRQSGVD
jgi:hypothetical protein